MGRISKETIFDVSLASGLLIFLLVHYLNLFPISQNIFIFLALIGILPVLASALESLKDKHINIDLLASVALIFSYIAGEWYSAAFINLMLCFSRLFDRWTEYRTGRLIDQLLKYRPETVRIKKDGQIIEIKTESVKVGDEVIVEAGGRIPVDGTVTSGQASLNESSLTGESELVVKKVGDPVYTATLNESGSIVVRAEKVGKDSRLEKIIELVKQASRKKASTEKIAEKFTQWYITIVFSGALILYIFTNNLSLILAVLLVVCADDIAVSLPLSFTATIARSAQLGILLKGSTVIEKLANIKVFITDKTGTLTKGHPQIASLESFAGTTVSQFNKYLATITAGSRHPINRTITKYLATANVHVQSADHYLESPGEGLIATIGKTTLISGKLSYLISQGVKVTAKEKEYLAELQGKGFGLSVLAKNKKLIGVVALEDGIKSNAKEVIAETKRLGVEKWVMLTGDNEVVASRVAKELAIDEYQHGVSPENKYYYVEKLKKSEKGILAMMGDGVNDSAALALADVSIAMGTIGSDVAIEAADVALMTDNLAKIPEAILISRENVKIIKQIFMIWAVTNSLGLILVFTGVLDPSKAAAYNFITDFFPIMNTLRLNLYQPKYENKK